MKEKGLTNELYRDDIQEMLSNIHEKQILRYVWIIVEDIVENLGQRPKFEGETNDRTPRAKATDTDPNKTKLHKIIDILAPEDTAFLYEYISETYEVTAKDDESALTWYQKEAIKKLTKIKNWDSQRFVMDFINAAAEHEND